ncbi:uncharacterized protein YdcH (DUF465 family) [Thalassobacillus pellis]|nr:uncharacterized protein YdcH (DUF465 family) [Thalassobacillus pellis]
MYRIICRQNEKESVLKASSSHFMKVFEEREEAEHMVKLLKMQSQPDTEWSIERIELVK